MDDLCRAVLVASHTTSLQPMVYDENTWIVLYDYVDGMAEKRTPHRERHLARIHAERDAGHLLIAGAYGDGPDGGAFGFRGVDRKHVEEFVAGDPYVEAKLVVKHTIEPWKLV